MMIVRQRGQSKFQRYIYIYIYIHHHHALSSIANGTLANSHSQSFTGTMKERFSYSSSPSSRSLASTASSSSTCSIIRVRANPLVVIDAPPAIDYTHGQGDKEVERSEDEFIFDDSWSRGSSPRASSSSFSSSPRSGGLWSHPRQVPYLEDYDASNHCGPVSPTMPSSTNEPMTADHFAPSIPPRSPRRHRTREAIAQALAR
uniref:ARAD1B11748p n=1 Tax=Blastobotrys adeninivorans TaxID=409370 RepID=A0A060T5I3_BLAAD